MSVVAWAELLLEEDVEGLWNALYQLVSRHPAVRPLHFATDGAAVTSQFEINADLTQELFLELYQKRRFDHYFNHAYTNSAIENELSRIELPNMVGARLRKRYPESFRMARRVSSLLKGSQLFKRFGLSTEEAEAPRRGRKKAKQTKQALAAVAATGPLSDEEDFFDAADDVDTDDFGESTESRKGSHRPGRMVNQVYGLASWPEKKPFGEPGRFADLVRSVPIRKRDTRLVGRTGSSQLILSNPELERLIVEVLTVLNSPADVRTLRQLVLSRIPLQDYNVASLDEELSVGSEGSVRRDAVDTRETPESALLKEEHNERLGLLAVEFLSSIRSAVNNNERRFMRLIGTLWHCYYDPDGPSQIEIAKKLGVSDSLVSDNRRLIEIELKKLKLSLEDGAIFSESLQRLVSQELSDS